MKITVILKNSEKRIIEAKEEQTILQTLWDNGITELPAPCGGRGRCGKCTVSIKDRGEVLACQETVVPGMEVYAYHREETGSIIADSGKGIIFPADGEEGLAAACDIGTTTVVCHLLDAKTGETLGTLSAPNAQKNFGADVLSRVQAASGGALLLLHEQITGQIARMLSELIARSGRQEGIVRLSVSANTIMSHLFAGISPESIGVKPFMPQEFFGRNFKGSDIGIFAREVYIAPAVAGFVGGDITADLLAQIVEGDMRETLLLDIGTNGEMAVGHDGSFMCCATAVGSAFEGAQLAMGMPAADGAISQVYLDSRRIKVRIIGDETGKGKPKGICGSGLLDALAVLLEMGLVDKRGMIADARSVSVAYRRYIGTYQEKPCIWITPEVCLTQEDIRDLQLAKAAFAAGMRILLNEKGIGFSEIERVIICGGFGSYMDKASAAYIGLIPKELADVTESVGNAAGEGAKSAAVSKAARERLLKIRDDMDYIELSSHPGFAEAYMNQMDF